MSESDAVDVETLYRSRFSPAEQASKMAIWKVLCEDFFSRFVRPGDTVLDIACGYGEFINSIQCKTRIAVDINEDAQTHLNSDVQFHNRSSDNLDCLPDESVDVAFESNFFEHLPSKTVLSGVVREVHRKLRKGGAFIVMQPNIKYVGSDYWDFYDHFIPLSHLSGVELLENCGFQIETVIPRFLPYTTKSRVPQAPWLVRLYLRVPLMWRIMGRQFLIVARKPS